MDAPDEEVMGPNMNFDELSTTMKCIISLTIQYMVVFTGLGICRTYLDFTKVPHESSALCKALKAASETMFYAPMVCRCSWASACACCSCRRGLATRRTGFVCPCRL